MSQEVCPRCGQDPVEDIPNHPIVLRGGQRGYSCLADEEEST